MCMEVRFEEMEGKLLRKGYDRRRSGGLRVSTLGARAQSAVWDGGGGKYGSQTDMGLGEERSKVQRGADETNRRRRRVEARREVHGRGAEVP